MKKAKKEWLEKWEKKQGSVATGANRKVFSEGGSCWETVRNVAPRLHP